MNEVVCIAQILFDYPSERLLQGNSLVPFSSVIESGRVKLLIQINLKGNDSITPVVRTQDP